MKRLLQHCLSRIDPKYPFTLVDVGAMGGIAKKWDPLRKQMRILAFEPDAREFAKLKSTERLKYFNCLVYRQPQDINFHIAKKAGASSVFAPNLSELAQFPDVERFQTEETVEIDSRRVKSMDDVFRENEISDADFMKVDTEGTELAIFEGSQKEVLPKVFGVQVEVEFIEKCIGQPLFRDVDALMSRHGFQIMDLRRQFWKRKDFNNYIGKGQLVFGDALYFKRLDVLMEGLLLLSDKMQRSAKIYKAILCCLIYRLFDYSVAITKRCCEKNFLTREEGEDLIADIQTWASRKPLPDFPGRAKLYALGARLLESLKPPSFLGFSDSDKRIGNIKDY